jgi:hypothetical protein
MFYETGKKGAYTVLILCLGWRLTSWCDGRWGGPEVTPDLSLTLATAPALAMSH